jgi:magnesium chelatase subunit D
VELLDAVPAIHEVEVDAGRVLSPPPRRDPLERGAIGRRDRSLVALRRGKYSRHRLPGPGPVDVAVDATLRAAASRAGRTGSPLSIAAEDVRRKVREHRVPYEVCFVVDNSYSLQADRLVEQVKGLVFGLLEDAAAHGDRVALVAFRSGVPEATVALRPTASRARAARALADVPVSGRTPLADALAVARRVLRQEQAKRPNALPVAVVVSDGLPNVARSPRGDALGDALREAAALRRARVGVVVVDAEPPGRTASGSCARQLAEAAGGVYLQLAELSPEVFADALEHVA